MKYILNQDIPCFPKGTEAKWNHTRDVYELIEEQKLIPNRIILNPDEIANSPFFDKVEEKMETVAYGDELMANQPTLAEELEERIQKLEDSDNEWIAGHRTAFKIILKKYGHLRVNQNNKKV